MSKLWEYFGFVGITSSVLWIAAVVILIAAFPIRPLRTLAYFAALLLAVLGFALAQVNSNAVSAIEVDRTEELKEAAERQRDMRKKMVATDYASQIKFAEDSPQGKAATQPAAAAGQPQEYGYKAAGKQKREEGKKREEAALAEMTPTSQPSEEAQSNARKMPEADVIAANNYDRANLGGARLALLAAVLMIVYDYLNRFNSTTRGYFPLPVAGRFVDSLFPKTHAVYFQTGDRARVKSYLETVVRKGESFLYFGPVDPWPSSHSIGRLRIATRRLLPLPKRTINVEGRAIEDETAFEDAWMGRACAVFVRSATSTGGPLIEDLLSYLRRRYVPGAPVRKTVHVVWDLPTPLPTDVTRELVRLSRDEHFKLVIVSANPIPPQAQEFFEEVIGSDGVASRIAPRTAPAA